MGCSARSKFWQDVLLESIDERGTMGAAIAIFCSARFVEPPPADDDDDAKTVARDNELDEKLSDIEDCKACLAMMQQLEDMFVELNRVDMGRYHFDAIQDKIGQIGLHV
mmetsp:Transcript_37218/g.59645  ORF Transcript_37218/g.59645 Transcript_37218/m.59645 type:complete len:109 (-) Transcript_37218:35-361(-)